LKFQRLRLLDFFESHVLRHRIALRDHLSGLFYFQRIRALSQQNQRKADFRSSVTAGPQRSLKGQKVETKVGLKAIIMGMSPAFFMVHEPISTMTPFSR
jgi:hypothetical protein